MRYPHALPALLIAAPLMMPSLTGCASNPPASETATDASLQRELDLLRARVAELEAENATLRDNATPATESELAQQLDDLQRRNRELEQLAGVVPAEDRDPGRIALIETQTTGDTTTVTSRSEQLDVIAGSRAPHHMSLVLEYTGDTPPTDAGITWYLMTQRSGDDYRFADHVTLTLDGETLTLPVTSYDRQIRRTTRGTDNSDEQLTITVDADALRRISNAVTAQALVRGTRLTLGPDEIATFRAMRIRVTP